MHDHHAPPMPDADGRIVELRQYTLHPGRRDALIGLFDHVFIEPQEAVGMSVIGQFRDLDDADRFVWLRGFADLAARQAGLTAFYGGPVWQAHRDAANATMIDSDDVLLLAPAWPGAGIETKKPRERAAPAATGQPPGALAITIHHLSAPADDGLLQRCRDEWGPAAARAGARRQGWYVTHPGPNNFPRLPVREGVQVLVHGALYDSLAALDAAGSDPDLGDRLQTSSSATTPAPATVRLRLQPTARSALHAGAHFPTPAKETLR